MGVSTPVEYESDIKNLLRCHLGGQQVEFYDFFTLKLGIKGFSDLGDRNIKIENSYHVLLRAYPSTFQKIKNLSPIV